MIKVINCKKKNYKRELVSFLDKRRSGKAVDTSIVPKILKDIKINGRKALLKYEKKFSQNTEIVPSKDKVNKAINTFCLLYTSPSPRDLSTSRMPSSA